MWMASPSVKGSGVSAPSSAANESGSGAASCVVCHAHPKPSPAVTESGTAPCGVVTVGIWLVWLVRKNDGGGGVASALVRRDDQMVRTTSLIRISRPLCVYTTRCLPHTIFKSCVKGRPRRSRTIVWTLSAELRQDYTRRISSGIGRISVVATYSCCTAPHRTRKGVERVNAGALRRLSDGFRGHFCSWKSDVNKYEGQVPGGFISHSKPDGWSTLEIE